MPGLMKAVSGQLGREKRRVGTAGGWRNEVAPGAFL